MKDIDNFKIIFDKLNDGIAIADIDTKKLIYCNKSLEKLLGYDKDELHNLSVMDIHPKESLDHVIEQFMLQAKGIIDTANLPVITKNGDIRVCNINASAYNLNNKTLNIGVFRDITDEIEQKNELQRLNDTLKKELEKNIEKDTIIAQNTKLAIMGEMISMIAHQWKQPLTAQKAMIDNIKIKQRLNSLNEDFLNRKLKEIEEMTIHMSSTIDDFANFFKPNKEKKHISISSIIDDTISLISDTFRLNSIEIEIKLNCKDISLYIYEREIKQAIINILINAKDALIENSIENKKIDIIATKDKEYINISIKDNALGIPAEIIEHIFTPYFSTKSKNGTGLGLYMSKTIIENHLNGKLSVENCEDGAKFLISLPIEDEG